MRWKLLATPLLGLLVLGCEPSPESLGDPDSEYTPATGGTVGVAAFLWHCTSDYDVVCMDQLAFPKRVAAGSTFRLEAKGWGEGSMRVELADSAIVTEVPGGLQALLPGWFAYWAVAEDTGRIKDFAHLEVAPVGRIQLGEIGDKGGFSDAPIYAQTGTLVEIALRPMEAGPAGIGEALAGTLGAVWSTSDPALTLLTDGELPYARVRASQPGEYTVTAQHGALVGTITVSMAGTATEPDAGSTDVVETDATEGDAASPDADADAGSSADTSQPDAAQPDVIEDAGEDTTAIDAAETTEDAPAPIDAGSPDTDTTDTTEGSDATDTQ
jgi:hypothetical protein